MRSIGHGGSAVRAALALGTFVLVGCVPGAYVYDDVPSPYSSQYYGSSGYYSTVPRGYYVPPGYYGYSVYSPRVVYVDHDHRGDDRRHQSHRDRRPDDRDPHYGDRSHRDRGDRDRDGDGGDRDRRGPGGSGTGPTIEPRPARPAPPMTAPSQDEATPPRAPRRERTPREPSRREGKPRADRQYEAP